MIYSKLYSRRAAWSAAEGVGEKKEERNEKKKKPHTDTETSSLPLIGCQLWKPPDWPRKISLNTPRWRLSSIAVCLTFTREDLRYDNIYNNNFLKSLPSAQPPHVTQRPPDAKGGWVSPCESVRTRVGNETTGRAAGESGCPESPTNKTSQAPSRPRRENPRTVCQIWQPRWSSAYLQASSTHV